MLQPRLLYPSDGGVRQAMETKRGLGVVSSEMGFIAPEKSGLDEVGFRHVLDGAIPRQ